MTQAQLIEAMTLIGFTETTDYTIGADYDSIVMVELDPVEDTPAKPSEADLQIAYDAEQARLAAVAEAARKAAVQVRIDALNDISMIVQEHIAASGETVEDDDSINTALLMTTERLEAADWGMANVPKPTIDEMEALQAAATASKDQMDLNSTNEAFLVETDWKILRHLREQHLAVTTSMTQQEFDDLEDERQTKAKAIVR